MEMKCDHGHNADDVRKIPYGTQGKYQSLCHRHFLAEMILRNRWNRNKEEHEPEQPLFRWDDLDSVSDHDRTKKMNDWNNFIQETDLPTDRQTELLLEFLEDEEVPYKGSQEPESILTFIKNNNLDDSLAFWAEACYQDFVEETL